MAFQYGRSAFGRSGHSGWCRMTLSLWMDSPKAYSRFRKNLARKLSHHSYKSAFTGSQRPICESGATVGVRENGS